MKLLTTLPFKLVYDNYIDPFIPQLWAQESLAILEENMVATALVHRDFEPLLAQYGDVVNTRRPGTFSAKRKTNSDPITVQNATSVNVQVPLNQQVHVSFLIKDGEESKGFVNLIDEYMYPAMLAQAQFLDQIVLGQVAQFVNAGNVIGGLGQLNANNAKASILATRQLMNINKAYPQGRNLILSPSSESALLNLDTFTSAYSVGDNGTALREASLGRKLGFDIFMSQHVSNIAATNTTIAGTVNHSGGYGVGTTVLTVTFGASTVVPTGSFITIAGDNTPYTVTAHTETSGSTTSITLNTGLRQSVANGAAITNLSPGNVNQSVSPTGYPAAYAKEIVYDNFSVAPQVGQLCTIGSGTSMYTIIQVNTTASTILLDRPLDVAINDDDDINLAPPGSYNFAFHRNAVALVVRPLAMPKPGTGALSAVVNWNDLSMRATITYDGNNQGHLVTLDLLCGVAILDTNLGAVLLG